MWPFKRKPGAVRESTAGEYPGEEMIRNVGWDEFDKEAELEASSNLGTAMLGPLSITGAMAGLRKHHSDSTDEQRGQRDTRRQDEEKT
jgi:hypothetical protein